jgi:hypothetical protein
LFHNETIALLAFVLSLLFSSKVNNRPTFRAGAGFDPVDVTG